MCLLTSKLKNCPVPSPWTTRLHIEHRIQACPRIVPCPPAIDRHSNDPRRFQFTTLQTYFYVSTSPRNLEHITSHTTISVRGRICYEPYINCLWTKWSALIMVPFWPGWLWCPSITLTVFPHSGSPLSAHFESEGAIGLAARHGILEGALGRYVRMDHQRRNRLKFGRV